MSIIPTSGLPDGVADDLATCLNQLAQVRMRNLRRTTYYAGENVFSDLGISLPPTLKGKLAPVMGWPAKAVDLLADRVTLERFVIPGGDTSSFGIPALWSENSMDSLLPQAEVSSLVHGPAFLTVTLGVADLGDPEVMITSQSALDATGLWSTGRQHLRCALLVLDRDKDGEAIRYVFVNSKYVVHIVADEATTSQASRTWQTFVQPNVLDRVPVESLTFKSRLDRPFGLSRITRGMMSHTDSAMRTVARAEVGAEMFSVPQRYLLGADESDFIDSLTGEQKSQWDLVIGRMLVLGDNDDPNAAEPRAEVGQFQQVSFQPHTDQMRLWSELFAAEASIPVSSLGIVTDNPSSAEAIYAAKEDLILLAERCGRDWTPPIVRTIQTAVQLRDRLSAPPAELESLGVRWRDPSTPSRAQATDATVKLIAAGVLPADSEVTLEMIGLGETEIQRILADRRLAVGQSLVDQLAGQPSQAQSDAEDADALKAKFDALGVAIRAGVDPESAARLLGLQGIEFTGAVPTSPRLPEADADDLEQK